MEPPKSSVVDLTELQDEGVLMAANERFFWPLGLALAWSGTTVAVDKDNWCHDQTVHGQHDVAAHSQDDFEGVCYGTKVGDKVRNLHVREWVHEDGHVESIGLAVRDEVATDRRARFEEWLDERLDDFAANERGRAAKVRTILDDHLGPTPTVPDE